MHLFLIGCRASRAGEPVGRDIEFGVDFVTILVWELGEKFCCRASRAGEPEGRGIKVCHQICDQIGSRALRARILYSRLYNARILTLILCKNLSPNMVTKREKSREILGSFSRQNLGSFYGLKPENPNEKTQTAMLSFWLEILWLSQR